MIYFLKYKLWLWWYFYLPHSSYWQYVICWYFAR